MRGACAAVRDIRGRGLVMAQSSGVLGGGGERRGRRGAASGVHHAAEVGRCRLTVSKPVLKAHTVSALENHNMTIIHCFQVLLSHSCCAAIPRSLAAVPSGSASSGAGGAGHHAMMHMAVEPSVTRWQRRRGGGRGGGGGGSFECVLSRGGAAASRMGSLVTAPLRGGGQRGSGRGWGGMGSHGGGVEQCMLHIGGAAPGFSVLAITAPLPSGAESGRVGSFALAAAVTSFHIAAAPQVRGA